MKSKQKSASSNTLIRSDEKLAMLGLFAIALTLGVFFVLPGLLNPVQTLVPPSSSDVYKVEEVPADLNTPSETYAEEYYYEDPSYYDMEMESAPYSEGSY
ncbi:MAG: hypothetical protein KatS3mg087_0805 [Patescibacteria group bacterium]|nr:MAG: hypothetical protein KatS3mg087_0805 [Patescibacteria group bacterium]